MAGPAAFFLPWRWAICPGLLLAILITTAPGCSCFQRQKTPAEMAEEQRKKEEEEKKKQKEKPKKNFEVGRMEILPGSAASGAVTNRVKPGHWVATRQDILANNFEFNAELHSSVVDKQQRPVDVERTPFTMTMSRPAPLPKGQLKQFENIYYVPRNSSDEDQKITLKSSLHARGGGREIADGAASEPTTRMKDDEYFMVVLADNPNAYAGFLPSLKCVEERFDDYSNRDHRAFSVSLPRTKGRPAVPSHPLAWTSTAYLIWDNTPPGNLLRDQQQSLIDWLHWGGQLIISGPRSVDSLAGTFLDPYLPADAVQSQSLEQEAFDEINDYWSALEQEGGKPDLITIVPERPPLGVELKLRPGAAVVPHTGGLIVEKRVGRGRIAMTRFALTDRQLTTWQNFDNFFNGAILRRPRRQFQRDPDYELVAAYWADPQYRGLESDARLNTGLRYFSRDVGYYLGSVGSFRSNTTNADPSEARTVQTPGGRVAVRDGDQEFEVEDLDAIPGLMPGKFQTSRARNRFGVQQNGEGLVGELAIGSRSAAHREDPRLAGFITTAESGVAGWNDFSGAADSARSSLKDAAGISIPRADFVLKMLGIYLLVLAPVNWAFFRLIGRVEWAWVAAPVIAIVGAIVVVRTAQLDIGFARSRTEIAILELQPSYGRAHLTRYSALYTSLSSSYDASYSDPSAVAQPFAVKANYQRNGETAIEVQLRREREITLSGFRVQSNTTGMLHSEQMYDVEGGVTLEGVEGSWLLKNNTGFNLQDAAVIRRTKAGYETAWIGDLLPKNSAVARFDPSADPAAAQWSDSWITSSQETEANRSMTLLDKNRDKHLTLAELASRPDLAAELEACDTDHDGRLGMNELIVCCRKARSGKVSLGRLFELASQRLTLLEGEARLVAWSDQPLEGVAFTPHASQVQSRTFVLAHLAYAPLPEPLSDVNTYSRVAEDPAKKDAKTKGLDTLFNTP
ncbi:hypothetical protein [Lignipirellula cremea]|uniref:EF-hand domain-containing protein n=1 Tax=Lignipirellula cremea TaxID=2528010 RepID=A0A518DTS0_9BACT|nr:hypothetical protein [Lignipirellula cremea]QDU95218.1 hypothetical protein Pla8534_30330 [Lignipirellula cremea]